MSRLALLPLLLLTLQAQAEPPPKGEVNAVALLSGARAVREDGKPSIFGAELFDGKPSTQYIPHFSRDVSLVVELNELYDLHRLEVINSSEEEWAPGVSVKTLRFEVGPKLEGPWSSAIEWQLEKGEQPQSRPVSLQKVRYLRVTMVVNYGNKDWIGLGEVRAWGRPSVPREAVFTGAWHTPLGQVRLVQKDQRVYGCFGPHAHHVQDTTIDGVVRGNRLIGTWQNYNANLSESMGPVIFSLTQEGDLSGVWGNTPSERTRRWDGKKLAEPTITCPRAPWDPKP